MLPASWTHLVAAVSAALAVFTALPRHTPLDLKAIRRRTRWGALQERRLEPTDRPSQVARPRRAVFTAAAVTGVLAAAAVFPLALVLLPAASWAAWVLPVWRAQRGRAAALLAEREQMPDFLMGWRALVSAGVVPVRALDMAARSGAGTVALAAREGLARYALGVPWGEALGRSWREAGFLPLAWLVAALAESDVRGTGGLEVLREQEHRLRQAQRLRSLEGAHRAGGRFVLVLTLTYLPAFLVGVLVPLFVAVMTRAFV